MRKTIQVTDIYTFTGERLTDSPYVEFAKQELQGKKSGYLNWLRDQLKKHKSVWGYIKTDNDCIERAKVFTSLCNSIKIYGFEEQFKMHFNEKKLAYGPITVQEKNGKLQIVDGLHRSCVLVALGHTELTVQEFVYSYQDMFPPQDKLKNLEFDWAGKSVIEVGCNIGKLRDYVLNRGAKSYKGYDHKEEYILEGQGRNPLADLKVMKAQKVTGECDVLCALGVFHHMEGDMIAKLLKNVKSKYIIFENPVGEKKLDPYKVRTKEWYFKLIGAKSVKEFQYGYSYPISRVIFVCER
jgi:2-polyprenyl-3-methyl-5-hydroxy-6-metoxy-1,4-benzoquinol methylase